MEKILLIITFLIVTFNLKAQTKEAGLPNADTSKSPVGVNNIYTAVEREPSFPGGLHAFFTYLGYNIKYPESAIKEKKQGKVFVSFIVEKDGSLTDTKVVRGVSPDIDAEAIRAVSHSPKWKPGIQNGQPVRVLYTMAINFKLPSQEDIKSQHLMDSIENLPIEKKVFTAVERGPSFPGGADAFIKYIKANLKYPDVARQNNTQGMVFLSFIIERDGSLSDVKVVKSLSAETDAEAIRLMNESPKWSPGMQNGVIVRVISNSFILFKLDQ